MDILYFFECDFPAVFTVNGVFFSELTKLKSEQNDILYITVLPLDAVYLPYTVKLGSARIYANTAVAKLFRLRRDRALVRFLPRFNYVYTPMRHEPPKDGVSLPAKLFKLIKSGDLTAARELLTPELSASVDDNSLKAFFDGYTDIVENNGYTLGGENTFFLIPDDNETASLFRIEYRGGLIDNIGEE